MVAKIDNITNLLPCPKYSKVVSYLNEMTNYQKRVRTPVGEISSKNCGVAHCCLPNDGMIDPHGESNKNDVTTVLQTSDVCSQVFCSQC